MDDLISRQAAIDAIEEYSDRLQMVNWKENPGVPYKVHALNWCVNTIRELPSAQPEQQWIPCSERLPEDEKKTYWVCTDTEYQCECRWTNNRFGIGDGEWGWSIFDTPQYSKPIAWMPLPEPWKGEDDAEVH